MPKEVGEKSETLHVRLQTPFPVGAATVSSEDDDFDGVDVNSRHPPQTYYVLDYKNSPETSQTATIDEKVFQNGGSQGVGDMTKRELARIPTVAVFHKLTSGKGVPHSFISMSSSFSYSVLAGKGD